LMTSYLGISVYLVGLAVQDIPFPDPNRMAQTLILTTVQGFLMVSGAILISTQATSIRAANLMASFIVIPMALLIQGEAVLLFWGNDQVLWFAIIGVAVLTILLARVGIAHFQRESLLGREIDVLNIRWIWRVFWNFFVGEANTPFGWYKIEIRRTLCRLNPSNWLTLVTGILSVVAGYLYIRGSSFIPGDIFHELGSILPVGVNIPSLGGLSFLYILGHNLQAVVIISLFGMVSFGTLGTLVFSLNFAIIGIVLGLLGEMGFSSWKIAVFGILPHGIFEISALILSCAAVLYGAIVLVTPRSYRSLGEVTIEAIAEWFRIFVGLVIPLLMVAAAIETWITPVLLSKFGK
jgi:uncharacterized membrane protein SpoIIM required for sporulation